MTGYYHKLYGFFLAVLPVQRELVEKTHQPSDKVLIPLKSRSSSCSPRNRAFSVSFEACESMIFNLNCRFPRKRFAYSFKLLISEPFPECNPLQFLVNCFYTLFHIFYMPLPYLSVLPDFTCSRSLRPRNFGEAADFYSMNKICKYILMLSSINNYLLRK